MKEVRSLILAVEVSCLLQVEDPASVSCAIFKNLAAIKVCFFPDLSTEFMSKIKSFGFQKGFQAVPKMSFLLKKRFANYKKTDHRKFGFFTLGATTLQARC